MTTTTMTIGEVSQRTGLTERTLRYYEELGLLAPERDSAGRRRYDAAQLDRLYRIRLLRELDTPLTDVDPDGADLLSITSRQLGALDRRIGELSRLRERVRTVEDRLVRGDHPADAELVGVMAGLPHTDSDTVATRRLTLLVYRDIEAAQRHLVDVFGFAAGPLARDDAGTVVHGEVRAGDGVVWMHREAPEHGLASPATLGAATHCMAVDVDDCHAHHERVRDAGGDVVYPPTEMPYGVLEYGARDAEGGLWSFMQPLDA